MASWYGFNTLGGGWGAWNNWALPLLPEPRPERATTTDRETQVSTIITLADINGSTGLEEE